MQQYLNRKTLFAAALFVYAGVAGWAMGYPLVRVHAWISAFLFFYLCYRISFKLFVAAVVFYTAIGVIYLPEAVLWGQVSSALVFALLETNRGEATEYLRSLPLYTYLCSAAFALFAAWLCRFGGRVRRDFAELQIIPLAVMLVAMLAGMLFYPIYLGITSAIRLTTAYSEVSVVAFPTKVYELVEEYRDYQQKAKVALSQKPTWHIESVHPKYKNYVLIIGESMRADYMSLYGYPLDTTPFLRQTNGVFLDGYVAAGPATIYSLNGSLYLNPAPKIEQQTAFADNIITLAKAAGFETDWLSNQGLMGNYDTASSRVAAFADRRYFTQSDSFNGWAMHDSVLLERLKDYLEHESPSDHKPHLFVMHLMGSHKQFCMRIKGEPRFTQTGSKEMACYLESIAQTDQLIKETTEALAKHGSWSLLYFSDHGLAHGKKNTAWDLRHSNEYRQNYLVPLVKLSSDDTARTVFKTRRSAFNFIQGFADWLGIVEPQIQQRKKVDFFSDQPEKVMVYDWGNLKPFDGLRDDPARLPPQP